jgi:sulfhydrogenase subunit delta
MSKPKVAFFSFSSCEGCQLMFLNLEDELLDLLGKVEIVKFREAMKEVLSQDYDLAFIEGSITTHADIEEIKHIREHTKILIAFGACATIGGINAIKNFQPLDDVRKYVYGDKWQTYDTVPTMAVNQVVKVDYYLHGCPVSKKEILSVVTALLQGKEPLIPDYPVCVECKLAENVCVYDKGMVCMGPVTRAGCGALCPSYGNKCIGCRGLISDPNTNAQKDLLAEKGLTVDDILKEFRMFDGLSEVSKK